MLTSEFEPDPARGAYPGEPLPEHAPISHLALVERADLYLIAPASANTIAKLAHGLADNLLSTAALAAACPIAVAPAMNNRMYLQPRHPDEPASCSQARGITVIDPGEGDLASHGEHGIGRLAEPPALLEACEALLTPASTCRGVRVLVTAGGTREPIDSVRFIGNRSSGRMGLELAAAAARRGAEVTLVAANVSLPVPPGVRVVPVQTAAELQRACEELFDDLRRAPDGRRRGRLPAGRPGRAQAQEGPTGPRRSSSSRRRTCSPPFPRGGAPTRCWSALRPSTASGAIEYGRGKLERKGLDAIVVNDISRPEIGFDAAENEVTILAGDGREQRVTQTSKRSSPRRCSTRCSGVYANARREGNGAGRADPRSAARI